MRSTPFGDSAQHTPPARAVAPKSSGSQYEVASKHLTPKSTTGDVERPAMKEVQRSRAPITKERPKFEARVPR